VFQRWHKAGEEAPMFGMKRREFITLLSGGMQRAPGRIETGGPVGARRLLATTTPAAMRRV